MPDPKHIHVSVAWPYANGDLHVGHLAGAYLPADIFARYHRLKGNHVLMVSGSDSHGTPISVEADKRGVTARSIFEHYHERFLRTQQRADAGLLGLENLVLFGGLSLDAVVAPLSFPSLLIREPRCLEEQRKGDVNCQ